VNTFLEEGSELQFTNGIFETVSIETATRTTAGLIEKANQIPERKTKIWFEFLTPCCIKDGTDVTTMVPHRQSVFRSLLNRWNATTDHPIENSADIFNNHLIEKPGQYNLSTASVRVAETGSGFKKFLQGFSGVFGYQLKNADQHTRQTVLTLAQFAELVGVGMATARGCGVVSTTIEEP
jgi:CRISPR-associated endoribonuclease Cas6